MISNYAAVAGGISCRHMKGNVMKEQFIQRTFNAASRSTIETVNQILDEYEAQGFRLSLRQLYYQLVARDYIPNNVRSYKNIGSLVSNARQAGLIDWNMIEDRNRETVISNHWDNPGEIIEAAAYQFKIDKWETQPWHVEVMVEKDALSGVLYPVCRDLDVGITANKGYSSSSTMYEIGHRIRRAVRHGKHVCLIYLGDHDPSGIDMTRDVRERLEMYSGHSIDLVRLALNMDQVEQWRPPENPAKETDARFAGYVVKYGNSSWELDAVEPAQLAALVRDSVELHRDQLLWDISLATEKAMKNELIAFAANYKRDNEEDDGEEAER